MPMVSATLSKRLSQLEQKANAKADDQRVTTVFICCGVTGEVGAVLHIDKPETDHSRKLVNRTQA